MTRVWAEGDYPAFADALLDGLGERVVAAAAIAAGERVLDVAAGCGNAALPAAARGARVTASDITPELLAEGRRRADAAGLALAWCEADAQALPFADAAFDVAVSCAGAMFAPRHDAVAAELARVVRRDGRIALLSWTPDGLFGALARAIAPFQPPPRPGAGDPVAWGDEAHVRRLLGGAFALALDRGAWRFGGFADTAALVAFLVRTSGPLRVLRARHADAAAIDAAIHAQLEAIRDGDGWPGGYLLVTGRRRG